MPPSTTVQPARATVAFPGTTALRTLAALRILLGAVLLWAFMAGLLLVGLALVLGVALRAAAVGGTALMVLMWLSALPIKSNPAVDEHIIYAAAMIAVAAAGAGRSWGLGPRWELILRRAPQPLRTVLT
ncbi:putative membrane protein YphA (DoxX/SURF4 family) [Arthrobacter silviterrae]|uniref:Uncharacterized protein n=1 Tax=Arthrobacter silviterrae TaxID=2026658 RepID=A0ABX0DHN2_9MICC|nr:hypothetical protein [Arthrobacter silviterrae]MDQ0276695.1 putative membrane protein YphA (DoxX/SURF4 family) [Arthrobacter silviterrae]NGN84080.1 hypothetical protein [Arthrobacter silviterrae]